jgi:hypothetical protein
VKGVGKNGADVNMPDFQRVAGLETLLERKRDRQLNARVDRELGRVPGIQRQRRQPGWAERNRQRLQQEAKGRPEPKSGPRRPTQEDYERWALNAIIDLLRSPPKFETSEEREWAFKNYGLL